jgi:hypothetical protein
MNRKPTHKIQRLHELVKTLHYHFEVFSTFSGELIDSLLSQIRSLIKELAVFISRHKIKHILGSAAVLFGFSVSAQTFEKPVKNPFGLVASTELALPSAIDLDGDGDLDILVGDYDGHLTYYENIGTPTNPSFAAGLESPFGIAPPDDGMNVPTFADLDDDGDFDLLVGAYFKEGSGYESALFYFKNVGTKNSPSFDTAVVNSLGLTETFIPAIPTFVDIDNDGDFDLFVGGTSGLISYIKNTGTKSNPSFAKAIYNPFGIARQYQEFAYCSFSDLDKDGDYDLIVGGDYSYTSGDGGVLFYYKNIGTASNPSFDSPTENPFGLSSTSYSSFPAFMDLDSDGDDDLLVGEYYGNLQYFKNTTPVASVEGLNNLGWDITIYPNPSSDIIQLKTPLKFESIEMVDMQGKIIKTLNPQETKHDIKDLQLGIYMLVLKDINGIVVKKQVVKK